MLVVVAEDLILVPLTIPLPGLVVGPGLVVVPLVAVAM